MTPEPVTLTVTLEQAVALCNLVGQLPTQSNAYPLWQTLVAQVQPLLPTPQDADAVQERETT